MTRRAELEEDTRLRITEATMALHEELGPARTSISAVAEQAGSVARPSIATSPTRPRSSRPAPRTGAPQTPRPTRPGGPGSTDPGARTEAALRELYAFYRRTEPMYTSLLRDEPVVPIIQQLLRGFHDYVRAIEGTLMAGRGLRGGGARRTRAAIGHAVAFPTWRSLTHDQGLADADAVRMMCLLVRGAA